MTAQKAFEDWWSVRGHLYPAQMKEAIRLAFLDGWCRALKAMAT